MANHFFIYGFKVSNQTLNASFSDLYLQPNRMKMDAYLRNITEQVPQSMRVGNLVGIYGDQPSDSSFIGLISLRLTEGQVVQEKDWLGLVTRPEVMVSKFVTNWAKDKVTKDSISNDPQIFFV